MNFSIITLTVIGRCVNQSFEHLSFNCILYLFVFYERLFQYVFFFNCAFGAYIGLKVKLNQLYLCVDGKSRYYLDVLKNGRIFVYVCIHLTLLWAIKATSFIKTSLHVNKKALFYLLPVLQTCGCIILF